MAKQNLTLVGKLGAIPDDPIVAVSDGTSGWVGCKNGAIYKYTIAGGVYLGVVTRVPEGITDMSINGTHLLVSTNKGKVLSYTLATMAYEGISLDLGGSLIEAIVVVSSTLYIVTNDGQVYGYTIS
jgi:hypothetical protein